MTPRHRWNRTLARSGAVLLAGCLPSAAVASFAGWVGTSAGLPERFTTASTALLFLACWLGVAGRAAVAETRAQRDEYRAHHRLCRRRGYRVSLLDSGTATCPECDTVFRRP